MQKVRSTQQLESFLVVGVTCYSIIITYRISSARSPGPRRSSGDSIRTMISANARLRPTSDERRQRSPMTPSSVSSTNALFSAKIKVSVSVVDYGVGLWAGIHFKSPRLRSTQPFLSTGSVDLVPASAGGLAGDCGLSVASVVRHVKPCEPIRRTSAGSGERKIVKRFMRHNF